MAISLFFSNTVLAIDYPAIPGISPITETSTLEEYAAYYYVLLVAFLIAVALVKLVATGVGLLVSDGNPQAFSKFKTEAIGVFVGIVVLLSPYIILTAIGGNGQKRDPYDCTNLSTCVIRETKKEDGKVDKALEMAIHDEFNLKEGNRITIKKYYGLQNVIVFGEDGRAEMVYSDDPSNNDRTKSLGEGEEVIIEGNNAERLVPSDETRYLKAVSYWARPVNYSEEEVEAGVLTFDWDGSSEVRVSGKEGEMTDVNADDILIIKNATNGITKQYGPLDNATWQGQVTIMELLSPGSNELHFIVKDKWSSHISISDIYVAIKGEKKESGVGSNVYVIAKREGAFLYELPNYSSEYYPPLFLKGDYSNLKDVNYENKVRSIDVVNFDETGNFDYFGIVSEAADHLQKCAVFNGDVADTSGDERLSMLGEKMNSINIFRRDKEYFKDLKIRLTLYNNTSCSEKGGEIQGRVSEQMLRVCRLTFINADKDISTDAETVTPNCTSNGQVCDATVDAMKTMNNPISIAEACPNLRGEVYSFEIDTPSAIIFRDSSNRCDIWDLIRLKRGEGTCNQVSFKGFSLDDFTPKKIFLIPYNR